MKYPEKPAFFTRTRPRTSPQPSHHETDLKWLDLQPGSQVLCGGYRPGRAGFAGTGGWTGNRVQHTRYSLFLLICTGSGYVLCILLDSALSETLIPPG